MNLKSKLRFPKSFAIILCLISSAIFSVLNQGCEKEDYNSPDRDEIINSIEFEEYIAANIELVSVYQKANAMLKTLR